MINARGVDKRFSVFTAFLLSGTAQEIVSKTVKHLIISTKTKGSRFATDSERSSIILLKFEVSSDLQLI